MKKRINIKIMIILVGFLSCTSINGQNDYAIDSARMGDIKLCEDISSVLKQYKTYEDLIFSGDEEEVTWIGKKIFIAENEWILIEASWVDSTKIWRISTNSPKYKTINGYKVGDKISKLKQNHEEISFYESEAGFELKSKLLSFGFSIESDYTDEFYKKVNECNYCADYLKYLNDKATITEIIISGYCEEK